MSYVFTLTAGRTGTKWLSKLIAQNTGIPSIHEPVNIDDFGITMPDIKIMRTFNELGNTLDIKNFWARKFGIIKDQPSYAESNHTLGKCGLIENLAINNINHRTKVILIKRENIVEQCLSYILRCDFVNITIPWQWYLHPSYKNKIVNPIPLFQAGGKNFGTVLWYIYEMEARLAYYKILYGNQVSFFETSLEKMVTMEGAEALLNFLGYREAIILPEKTNHTLNTANENLRTKVTNIVSKINFDAYRVAESYIEQFGTLVISE